MPVQNENIVRVEYEGYLDDGRIFDSTEQHGFPLRLTIGAGVYLEAFEQALVGMEVEEEKVIRLSPQEAYGEYLPERVETIDRKNLPTKTKLEEGTLIILTSPEGKETPAKVVELTETQVTLDFNHPLAGIPLNFRLTLLEITQ
jgi:peptidylprolyl isomerase